MEQYAETKDVPTPMTLLERVECAEKIIAELRQATSEARHDLRHLARVIGTTLPGDEPRIAQQGHGGMYGVR